MGSTARVLPTTIPIVGDYRGIDRSRSLDRLLTPKSFASGSFRFVPPPAGLRARNGPGGAQALALRSLPKAFRTRQPVVFFAVYLGRGPTKDAPAWAIVYAGVPGQRATGVVKRKEKAGSTVPTTVSRDVVTDLLVIVDDKTGAVVVRSEFAPGS